MNTSTSRQPADIDSYEDAPSSSRPIDHAQMVLAPVLLLLGLSYLFIGPGTLLENASVAAALVFLGALNGWKVYRRWTANS